MQSPIHPETFVEVVNFCVRYHKDTDHPTRTMAERFLIAQYQLRSVYVPAGIAKPGPNKYEALAACIIHLTIIHEMMRPAFNNIRFPEKTYLESLFDFDGWAQYPPNPSDLLQYLMSISRQVVYYSASSGTNRKTRFCPIEAAYALRDLIRALVEAIPGYCRAQAFEDASRIMTQDI